MKCLLALALLVSAPASAATLPLTLTVAPASTACSRPSPAGQDDGCGRATPGPAQLPNLLSTYPTRPAWNVAGVDYAVGVPPGALRDLAASSLPVGCAISGAVMSCTAAGVVIQGYDFSIRGIRLSVSADNATVTGNRFGFTAASCQDPLLSVTGANPTITYNTIDGGGALCASSPNMTWGTLVNVRATAGTTAVLQYNLVLNTPQDSFDFGGFSGTAAKVIIRYNLLDQAAWRGHPDGLQFCGGNFTPTITFNTFHNTATTPMGTQPLHIEAQCTSAITNTTLAYNTALAQGLCNGGRNWPAGCSANQVIACKQDAGSNSNIGFAAYANYVDWTGALSALLNSGCQQTTWGAPVPNVDISTGRNLPSP